MEASNGKTPEELEVERAREQLKGMFPIAILVAAAVAAGYVSYQPGSLLRVWDWAMRIF